MVLSVIMPCYNGEKFVSEAIESVLNQNNNDVELIVVNDGSTDNTEEICKKYSGKNFRYVKIENAGAGHARNVGVEAAEGKWISFLDADDLYLPNSLGAELIDFLSDNENIDIVYTAKAKTNMTMTEKFVMAYPETEIKKCMPRLEFWTCIYGREFILKNNIRFFEYKPQDIETAFRFKTFYYAKNICVDKNRNFYLQRENPESNTHTLNLYSLYYAKMASYFELYGLVSTERRDLLGYISDVVVRNYALYKYHCVVHGADKDKERYADAKRIIRDLKNNKKVPLNKSVNKECLNVFKEMILSKKILDKPKNM